MMRSGFSLIETLIATAIATILGGMVMIVLYQTNRLVPSVERYSDRYLAAELVFHQMARDFAGAEVPIANFDAFLKQGSKEQTPVPESKDPKQKAEQKKEDKKVEIPIKKVFVGTVSGSGMLDMITCITTAPLQPYWGQKTGKYIPRIVRVTYRLREDPAVKGTKKQYVLLRQESENLDPEKMEEPDPKKFHAYMLAHRIVSFKVEYTAAIKMPKKAEDKKADQAKQKKNATEKQTYELKTFKEWKERSLKADEKEKEPKEIEPLLPQALKIEMVMSDAKRKTTQTFSFIVPIITEYVYPPEKKADTNKRLLESIKQMSESLFPALGADGKSKAPEGPAQPTTTIPVAQPPSSPSGVKP